MQTHVQRLSFGLLIAAIVLATPALSHGQLKKSYLDDSKLAARVDEIMAENNSRIKELKADKSAIPSAKVKPGNSAAWWQGEVGNRLRDGGEHKISIQDLFVQTLKYSTQIKVFSASQTAGSIKIR